MRDFYKYLPANKASRIKDLVVINAGHTRIPAHSDYPASTHPTHHHFRFQEGRRIDEYQVVYISQGKGIFESESFGRSPINSGDCFLLFPGEWHRYKPDPDCGWTENWVGFSGEVAFLQQSSIISPTSPVVKVGLHEEILKLFDTIFQLVKNDYTAAEFAVSGATNYLLGLILTARKRELLRINSHTDEIIAKAKMRIHQNYEKITFIDEIAKELNISYVWFRTCFKKHTGLSPYEYLQEVRLNAAKILLQNSNLSIKEIADASGFNSQYQFSKIFKLKTGKSPSEYREQ